MIFIILIITFIFAYITSFIIKPFIAVFFGNKIKRSQRKDDQYYREQYNESRKHIESLDKGFLKSVAETLHGSDCSEEEYITTQRKKEEKEYNSTLDLYSFCLSFLCILVLIGFVFLKENKDSPTKLEKPKNPIAEKEADFRKYCKGLKKDTLESDFLKLTDLQEQADMMKKRAKVLYKQGLITRSQYQQAKDSRSVIGQKYNQYSFCLNAKADYRRAIATTLKKESQEKVKDNAKQPKKDDSNIKGCSHGYWWDGDSCVYKKFTNSEIKKACQHCIKHYNCMIKIFETTGKFPKLSALNICEKGRLECWQLKEFLRDNKFISEKHKEQYNSLFEGPKFYWHAFPDLYKHCSEKRKVPYHCKTAHCRSNNPNGIYFVTEECDYKNRIESFKFLRDVYCGKLQKQFFKL